MSESSSPPPAEGPAPTRGSLAVVFLTVFIDLLGFGMVLPLLPLYADQFAVDSGGWQLGLLMASFSAMQFIFAPLWGRLSDAIGRRPVLIIGLSGSVVFYLLFAYATIRESLLLLFASRIGAGVAGATISTAQAYIADCTTAQRRSKGMALIGMAFGLGFTLGPLVGLLAVPSADAKPGPWPGYAAAGLSAFALGLALFRLPESRHAVSQAAESHRVSRRALRTALSVPSVGLILTSLFVCVFSFAMFETTLSLLIKGGGHMVDSPFAMNWQQVCWTFAYIGLTLTLVQGGLVRRLAGRVSEGALAGSGAGLEIVGFALMLLAVAQQSTSWLLVALGVVVAGFAFMQPSLNGLLSRRSDPQQQGVVMGVGQSVSSLARIVGSAVGIPLLAVRRIPLLDVRMQMPLMPFYAAIGLMALGLLLVLQAARRGRDF